MSRHSYIPAGDAEFDVFFKNIVDYVLARVLVPNPPWTHIPPAEAEALAAAYTSWHVVYEATLVPHTPVQTAAKNRSRKSSQTKLEAFVNRFLRWPPVTNEDRDNTGVPNRDPHPTPVPKPTGIPEVGVETPKPRVLRFRFRGPGMKRWGKPKGIHGMELAWVMADEPPASVDDFPHSEFATRNPLDLVFDEADRGKRVYYAARWETEAAKKGDYSAISWVIIP
jgi:hypothetical protein